MTMALCSIGSDAGAGYDFSVEVVTHDKERVNVSTHPDQTSNFSNRFPFQTRILEHNEIVDEYSRPEVREKILFHSKAASDIHRAFIERGGTIDERNNPGLDHILGIAPQIADWRRLFTISPSLALEPFYNPGAGLLSPAMPLEASAREWLTDQQLGIGLRNRYKIEQQILGETFNTIFKNRKEHPNVLVMASGRGRGPITAAGAYKKKYGVCPNLTLVDIDETALARSEGIAYDSDIATVRCIARDIVHTRGFMRENIPSIAARTLLRGKIPKISLTSLKFRYYDVIDSIGFMMYLPIDNWKYEFEKKIFGKKFHGSVHKIGACEYLKRLARHVKPGGYIIFDSVDRCARNTKKGMEQSWQLDVIDSMRWQKLRTRDETDNLKLIQDAGIRPQWVSIDRDPSGLFSIYTVKTGRGND
jgi:hypothetical protein